MVSRLPVELPWLWVDSKQPTTACPDRLAIVYGLKPTSRWCWQRGVMGGMLRELFSFSWMGRALIREEGQHILGEEARCTFTQPRVQ